MSYAEFIRQTMGREPFASESVARAVIAYRRNWDMLASEGKLVRIDQFAARKAA